MADDPGQITKNDPSEDDEDLFGDGSDQETAEKSPETTAQETSPTKNSSVAGGDGVSDKPTISSPSQLNNTQIPRISPAAKAKQASQASPVAVETKGDGSKFGLPAGVSIPKSVHSNLLHGRLLETLRGLPLKSINDALTEYDDAVQIKGSSIRNHGAYLFGVIKRYVSVQEREKAGFGSGMGNSLTPAVRERLKKLVEDKFCTEDEMSDKIKTKLRMLSEKDALSSIDELASVERSGIRNFGSYYMGILNRYMRGDAKKHPGNQKGQDSRNDHGRFHRGNNSREHDFRRGRASATNNHNDSYRRERSRDRFDQGRSNVPSQQTMLRAQYDTRLSNPPFPQYNQGPMGAVPGNLPPPPPPPPPPRPALNNNLSQPQAMQPQPLAQQPPPQFVPQQMQMGGISTPSYGPGPSSQYPAVQPQYTGTGGLVAPQAPATLYGANPSLSPPIVGQQPPQAFLNPSLNNVPSNAQGGWQNQQQQVQPFVSSTPNLDILGLADKAASAVQALQSQNSNHISPPPMQQTVYPGVPQQATIPQMYAPQPYPSVPQGQNSTQGQNGPHGTRRRTTAKMNELPVTIQYAIQNLQVTGKIDGNLDEGILGMIKDLPESLALQSFHKFSLIDQKTMRNKTAYFAGVLRRELEKIRKR